MSLIVATVAAAFLLAEVSSPAEGAASSLTEQAVLVLSSALLCDAGQILPTRFLHLSFYSAAEVLGSLKLGAGTDSHALSIPEGTCCGLIPFPVLVSPLLGRLGPGHIPLVKNENLRGESEDRETFPALSVEFFLLCPNHLVGTQKMCNPRRSMVWNKVPWTKQSRCRLPVGWWLPGWRQPFLHTVIPRPWAGGGGLPATLPCGGPVSTCCRTNTCACRLPGVFLVRSSFALISFMPGLLQCFYCLKWDFETHCSGDSEERDWKCFQGLNPLQRVHLTKVAGSFCFPAAVLVRSE